MVKSNGIWHQILQLEQELSQSEHKILILNEPEVDYQPGAGNAPDTENGARQTQPGLEGNWFSVTLGQNIRKQRREKKMTQQELAKRMHYDRSKITRIEKGQMDITGQVLNQICRELDCMLMDVWPDQSVIGTQGRNRRELREAVQLLLEKLDRIAEDEAENNDTSE